LLNDSPSRVAQDGAEAPGSCLSIDEGGTIDLVLSFPGDSKAGISFPDLYR
jgi:hypothetical protein